MSKSKPIPGFPGYSVTKSGKVSGPNGPLSPRPDDDGYLRVDLRKDGERKTRFVHTLVNSAWNGGSKASEVDHKNRDRTNNNADNLKSSNRSENLKNRKRWSKLIK